MQPTIEILIVGAGPAGLACAISLLSAGVKSSNIVIVDAQQSGLNSSRAVVVHAQTTEDLASIGCADPLVARGLHARHITVIAKGKSLITGDFGVLTGRARFPYALLISQSETEAILETRLKDLGVEVVRPLAVTGMVEVQDPSEVRVGGLEVSFANGEKIRAKYVIAADGARSTVRTLAAPTPTVSPLTPPTSTISSTPLNLSTSPKPPPPTASQYYSIIANVHLSGNLPPIIQPSDFSVFLSDVGFLLLVPLPPNPNDPQARPIYRLSCPIDAAGIDGDGNTTTNTNTTAGNFITAFRLQSVLNAALGLSPDTPTAAAAASPAPVIDAVLWSSRFQVRYGVADTLFHRFSPHGVVLLVGDAAHVHSPAGGQGMNLGLRDALALGRTLAAVLAYEDDFFPPSPVSSASAASARVHGLRRTPTPEGFADRELAAFLEKRRKLALEVIKMTQVITWATGLRGSVSRAVRNFVVGVLEMLGVGNRIAVKLSGVGAG